MNENELNDRVRGVNPSTNEYREWARYMASRRGLWTQDQVHRGLFYCGNANDASRGVFIRVREREVTAGTYEGALPCITDGLFQTKWAKSVPSFEAGYVFVAERIGVRFLRDQVTGRLA